MSNGIADIVQAYLKQSVILQPEVIEDRVFKAEFNGKYEQLIPTGRLEQDIKALAGNLLSSYQAKVPNHELNWAVHILLAKLKLKLEQQYVGLRITGVDRDTAFENALKPIGELIQAVLARNIKNNPFYSEIETYLTGVAEEGLMPSGPL